jgi:hypothetical protein
MHIAAGFALFPVLSSSAQGQSRHCTKVPVATQTRWGGNQRIEIDLRDKPVRTVRGNIEGPGEGTLSTLVQVFPRQPSDPLYRPADQENERPVAACVTGDDGFFAFSLPTGEYELRMSQNNGIDVTSVFVKVEKSSHSSEKIMVVMHVGT